MILMYHKVHPLVPTMWWVSPDAFHRQMCELAAYEVMHLADYDPTNPRHAVITFDGAYENVLRYAAPILKRFGYPFEVFVVGDTLGKGNYFDVSEPPARFADQDQLALLVEAGGRIQWHTRSHCALDDLSDEDLTRELTPSPELVARFLRPHLEWFAYPHGEHSPRVEAAAAKIFKGAVSCVAGNATDRFKLNRTTVVEKTSLTRKKVTAIIPNFNYGRYIVEAIESVLAQTAKIDEILIVDDGSSDESRDIIATYAHRAKIVLNPSRLGIVKNFNNAVAHSSGDYIFFLGADNRLRCDYVEECRRLLDAEESVGAVSTDILLFGPLALQKQVQLQSHAGVKTRLVFEDHATGEKLIEWAMPTATNPAVDYNTMHGSSLYRRDAFENVGGYRETPEAEDKDLFQRMKANGWKMGHVPQPLLEYRQHSLDQANYTLGVQTALSRQTEEVLRLRRKIDELQIELASFRASDRNSHSG